jgi:hypothetical protein
MLVDPGTEVRARMRDRMREAERWRLAAAAGAGRAGGHRSPARYRRRLRQAAGFGLVRTGLWLLDARRVGS